MVNYSWPGTPQAATAGTKIIFKEYEFYRRRKNRKDQTSNQFYLNIMSKNITNSIWTFYLVLVWEKKKKREKNR